MYISSRCLLFCCSLLNLKNHAQSFNIFFLSPTNQWLDRSTINSAFIYTWIVSIESFLLILVSLLHIYILNIFFMFFRTFYVLPHWSLWGWLALVIKVSMNFCVWSAGPVPHGCKRCVYILELWFDFYFETILCLI